MAGHALTGLVIVPGAAGQFGRAAAQTFRENGWQVASLVHGRSAARAAPATEVIEVDARDRAAVVAAAQGVDVIVHALNVPFTEWARLAMPLAETAVAAARETGATLVVPSNLYNYGAGMPSRIDEATEMRPTARKGALRLAIEMRLKQAAEDGLRVIVLRAGDYFGGAGLGAWFDRVIIKDIAGGRLTYPGPLDAIHDWAYLPDLAQALVRLVEASDRLAPYASLGFAGHAVTGHAFTAAIGRACRREFKVGTMPWRLLRTAGVVIPVFRELSEIAYLWSTPHAIDGEKLAAVIGQIPRTPLDPAVAAALAALGFRRRAATQG
jgi:nucleoside-diphosphate-sugar epimerase